MFERNGTLRLVEAEDDHQSLVGQLRPRFVGLDHRIAAGTLAHHVRPQPLEGDLTAQAGRLTAQGHIARRPRAQGPDRGVLGYRSHASRRTVADRVCWERDRVGWKKGPNRLGKGCLKSYSQSSIIRGKAVR